MSMLMSSAPPRPQHGNMFEGMVLSPYRERSRLPARHHTRRSFVTNEDHRVFTPSRRHERLPALAFAAEE